MMRATCFLLATLALATGSASAKNKPFEAWVERDQFAPDMLVVSSSSITIKDVQFFNPWFALFQAKYLYNKATKTGTYVFDITYYGSDWMFWDALTIKLSDNEVRRLDALGSPRRDTRAGGVEEYVRFVVPEEAMARISGMPRVDMRVNGKYYYDFLLTNIGTAGMKLLMSKVNEVAPSLPKGPTAVASAPSSGATSVSSTPSYINEIRELAKLRDQGVLTEEEFTAKKRQLLGAEGSTSPPPVATQPTPDPSAKIAASIDGSVSARTEAVTTIAWILRVTTTGPSVVDAEIQFLDASGGIVASERRRDLRLSPDATSAFNGTSDLPASDAARVVRLGVKVTARQADGPLGSASP